MQQLGSSVAAYLRLPEDQQFPPGNCRLFFRRLLAGPWGIRVHAFLVTLVALQRHLDQRLTLAARWLGQHIARIE